MEVRARRRYFVVEQPLTALSWIYGGVLQRLADYDHILFVRCDQCAYGAKDKDTGQAIKKAT
eukprot:4209430-Prorocentrum_lima.AAC.1